MSTSIAYRWLPWRSAMMGWFVAVLALMLGVPLFVCMPQWVDVTLYDLAVRNVLRGGVHYRDVFDTNLPGIVWTMATVRLLLGWSYEALRIVDLLIIAGEVWLLLGWVRKAGGTPYSIAWLAASFALFYPFTSEFCHMQRDPWLLLPALIAAKMRLARVEGATIVQLRFDHSLLEGLIWGAAVWLKPHVVFPAFALWAASAILIARRAPFRCVLRDLAGLLLGGMIAGAVGVAWLVGTGAWPYFLDVFLNWNPNYMAEVLGDADTRFIETFEFFRPWGLLQFVSLPLAVLALWEARVWSRRSGDPRKVWGTPWLYAAAETEVVANTRLLLAALYLGWLAQAVVFQKGFDYVQIPIALLGMSLVASQRWAFGFAYLLWFALLAIVLNATDLISPKQSPAPGIKIFRLEHMPFTNPEIVKLWPRCLREGGSPELRDKLGQYADIPCSTGWRNLTDVAVFLKKLDPPLGPGELNCWHDSTHPLYLMLDLEPATRYMHYGTVFAITSRDDWIKKRVAAEVAASRQRYVVSDLSRLTFDKKRLHEPSTSGDSVRLPSWFPDSQRDKFPWNQPVVFRSGRYLVHKIANPLGEIDIPDCYIMDDLDGEK